MHNPIEIVEAYYAAMNRKDADGVAAYLHPDVAFISPLAKMHGKETVLKAVRAVLPLFETITIRATMNTGNQVMLAYNWNFAEPIGLLRAAGLFTVKDGLILKIELFYDGRPFAKDLLSR